MPPVFLRLALAASVVLADAGAAQLSWEHTPDSIALRSDNAVVWRFNAGTNATKPYFDPVALPGLPSLTWDRPEDHRWHRALWFSWKFINGVNYWEEDPQTGAAAGRTVWTVPVIEARPDHTARISLDLTYQPPGQPPVLAEKRVLEVAAPAADGTWFIDWDMTFVAQTTVRLDRTPLPDEPEGKPYGGYAGLSVRLARDFGNIQALTTETPVAFSGGRFRGKAIGFDYTGTLQNQQVGIAILDHPDNLNSPSPWYAIHDGPMRYFSPAVLCYGPHTLNPGQTLRLRYRVIVHPGGWDSDQLRRQAAAFGH